MYVQKSFSNKTNPMYIIPTPIGNLEDITIRAINVLKELDYLYCEDTRVTGKLLNHLGIKMPLKKYTDYDEDILKDKIFEQLSEGLSVGLVSDAGMPGISDPGFKLINFLKSKEYPVVILPGPCAFIQPMVYFTQDSNPYVFHGFLPKKKSEYEGQLKQICQSNLNDIIYETPHRINKTLELIESAGYNNTILIAREISKLYESYIEGEISEVLEYVLEKPLKGEIVLLISKPNIKEDYIDPIQVVQKKVDAGMYVKDATKDVAKQYGLSKRELYNDYMKKKQIK